MRITKEGVAFSVKALDRGGVGQNGLTLVAETFELLSKNGNGAVIRGKREWNLMSDFLYARREYVSGNDRPLRKFGDSWELVPEDDRLRLQPCIDTIRGATPTGKKDIDYEKILAVNGEVTRGDVSGWDG